MASSVFAGPAKSSEIHADQRCCLYPSGKAGGGCAPAQAAASRQIAVQI
jgi:hypothetical protein